MSDISERFSKAVEFLKKNGYAKNDGEIARRIGSHKSSMSMALDGTRGPGWGMLLDLCDAYPINFWWLRSGKGSMVREDREVVLLKRIEELEKEIARLKG